VSNTPHCSSTELPISVHIAVLKSELLINAGLSGGESLKVAPPNTTNTPLWLSPIHCGELAGVSFIDSQKIVPAAEVCPNRGTCKHGISEIGGDDEGDGRIGPDVGG
jgi:hypothetical protein